MIAVQIAYESVVRIVIRFRSLWRCDSGRGCWGLGVNLVSAWLLRDSHTTIIMATAIRMMFPR